MNDKHKTPQDNPNGAKAVPLAIVGIGCLFPRASDAETYWHNIRDGVDAITEIPATHWKPEDYFDADVNAPDMTYARRGGFIDPVDFDPLLYGLSPNNIEATDTTQLLGMAVARQALLDAGYATAKDSDDGRQFDRDRTSVILGVTGTLELVIPLGARLGHPIWRRALADAGIDKDTAEDIVQRIADGYVPWQENSFPGLLGNVAAGRIANRFDLGGTNCVVDAACASSLSAIHMAALELYAGRSDMAITGGFDTFNDIFMYMCFSKTPALSPTGNSRPFDFNGDGTILGEGLGAIILKRLDDAQRDGDKIYAVLKGIGSSSDGRGNAIYAPSASGQTKALKAAYAEAGIRPRSIELVEAHGTGTKVGDAVEAEALSAVFREDQAEGSWCAIGSVKSMIGHTKAAAGVAGLIKIAMALRHKVLPPTIKVEQPLGLLSPGAAPVYVNTNRRPWVADGEHPRRAALSAFGFGGSNFHCVLEEAESEKPGIDWDGKVLLFAFSADTAAALQARLKEIDSSQSWQGLRAAAARTRRAFDAGQDCRLSLVLSDASNADNLFEGAAAMLRQKPDAKHWSTPDGAWFGCGEPGKLAMLFPGQGSQYNNMLLDLACQFPDMQTVLGEAGKVFAGQSAGQRLHDLIYPIPVFTEEARAQNEAALRATRHAQPAIGACNYGALSVLRHFGLQADASAGHSFGELTALCAAGVFDAGALHRLANKRGELMQAKTGDHGAMLAVSASAAVIHEFLEGEPLDLIIANNNAPTQVVLSGASDQIDLALARFQERSIAAKKLPVSAAFHSIYVADAERPFAQFLKDISFTRGEMTVYANTTAEPYPDDAEKAKALLAGQLAKPVEFVAQIENMHAAGITTFVEVGPGKTLSSLVGSILAKKDHHAIAVDASRGRRNGQQDLASVLAELSALGHGLELDRWDAGYLDAWTLRAKAEKPLMTVSLSGANYVKPRPVREPRALRPPAKAPQTAGTTPASETRASQPAANLVNVAPGHASEALQVTQQSILALQTMQVQTAQLHKQYLEGQQAAQESLQQLIRQQQQLLGGAVAMPASHGAAAAVTPVVSAQPVAATPATDTVAPAPARSVAAAHTGATSGDRDHYERLLLEVVADKTGYPVNMLSMDMSLDTDLGIDSIKRVEILSALQERLPGVTRIQPEDLGTFQMLKHIVEFLAADVAVPELPLAASGPDVIDTRLQTVLLEVVADKTGYPVDMLDLGMNMDTDLGIDSIKRVEILSAFQEAMPEAPTVSPEDLASLQTLQQIVDFMQSSMPAAAVSPAVAVTKEVAATAAVADSRLEQVLLAVVADKTGYPVDMLNLDMNMDSDLGIDSIKRVEILSAFQEQMPEAPTVSPEDLASLQTLRQIADFMHGQSATPLTSPVPVAASATATSRTPGQDNTLQAVLLEVVAEKTGYPVEMLNLDMNMDTDLGIDSIKRVEILSALQTALPGAPAVNPEDLAALQTLQQIVEHMGAGNATAKPVEAVVVPAAVAQGEIYRSQIELRQFEPGVRGSRKPADGSLVLVTDDGSDLPQKICAALEKKALRCRIIDIDADIDSVVTGLIILAPVNTDGSFLRAAFLLLQRASAALRRGADAGNAILTSVTRLGGGFGLDTLADTSPVAGGLAGLIKTAAHEWPTLHCKALDIAGKRSSVKLANAIVEEAIMQGPVETGIRDGERYRLSLQTSRVVLPGSYANPFAADDVIVISGGARGVTAEVALALARHWHTDLLLLGRSALAEQEVTWAAGLHEETAIKQAIIRHGDADLTPALVEKEYRKLLADREIRDNIRRIEDCGVRVRYHAVDVRDKVAVKAAIDAVRAESGNIAAIIHGAGVLADRLIQDKTADQYDAVYSTKVDGLHSLLEACAKDELKALVMFSSSTARFGRKGQADYAIANEVLNKVAQQQQQIRPGCRVLSVNWGPWDGGMVTEALKKLFESEGVGVIPLATGAEVLLAELSRPGPVELVVLGSEPAAEDKDGQSGGAAAAPLHLVSEHCLSVAEYPVLASHVMNGKAVLPAALVAEWLAHGAMHNHPGLSFIGFNDLRILKGVVIGMDETLNLQIMAGETVMQGEEDLVTVELCSGKVLHARAEVVLGTGYPRATMAATEVISGSYPFRKGEYYTNGQLFHGPDLQCLQAINACSVDGISGEASVAPPPSAWIKQPMRSSWLADPMLLDASFQMMILWTFQQSGHASLPTRIGSYRQFQRRFPKQGASISIHVDKSGRHSASAHIEIRDRQQKLLARMEAYECVIDASLNDAFRRNRLEQTTRV